jgi:hypothetical protein
MEHPALKGGTMSFYTTLDSVLDTRLGCLRKHFPHRFENKEAVEAITKDYGTRRYESFPGIGCSEFRALYLTRDKVDLSLSSPTELRDELIRFAVKIKYDAVQNNTNYIPNLVLNTYPYVLESDKEKKDLAVAMRIMVCNELDVEIVYIKPEELTPSYCIKNYVCMAMYDYSEWLDIHTNSGAFQSTPIPEITLMVPEVWLDSSFSEEEFKVSRKGKTVADTLEVMASGFIGLQFIPVTIFCYTGAAIAAKEKQLAQMTKDLTQGHQSSVGKERT